MEVFEECKKYSIPIWQCPSFLFLIMGTLIAFSSISIYLIGTKFVQEPRQVALIVLLISAVLFLISFLITKSFEKLAEANRLKSEFVSIVSHQLQTPISNLRWALDLMFSEKLGAITEKQLEILKVLRENSDRMKELVKDLLLVSRIEAEKLSLKNEKFSLEDLTKEIISKHENFARAFNVEIKFSFEKNLPKIFAPKDQIAILIEKLLENAIQYTKGKGLVQIRIEKKGKNLYFEIEDNGIGIPKKDQKFIFQKFFRASNVSKHQTLGTGLGLFICKKIVEKIKGKIGFVSQENKGSKFFFYLPIK